MRLMFIFMKIINEYATCQKCEKVMVGYVINFNPNKI